MKPPPQQAGVPESLGGISRFLADFGKRGRHSAALREEGEFLDPLANQDRGCVFRSGHVSSLLGQSQSNSPFLAR